MEEGIRKVIFHVDMDAFFVSVEELFDPGLKGKAVIVGGKPDQRGVVSAASYEARKFGIHSAMPLVTAKRLCPHAIFLPGRHKTYAQYSEWIRHLLESYSPIVEMVSIDEAYLDLTGFQRTYGHPQALAERLRNHLLGETGLSASVGISASKLVSKVASDLAKPKGVLYVLPGHEAAFLGSLGVGKLPGVGKVTQQRLRELGISRVGQLAEMGTNSLRELFGRWGESLYQKSQGMDTAHFEFRNEPQSIGHEHTFDRDTGDSEEIQKTIAILVDKCCHRLRKHRMFAKTVRLKIRDQKFYTQVKALTLQESTQLDVEILHGALTLLERHWKQGTKLRLVGVSLSGLDFNAGQEALFSQDRRDKMLRLHQAADRVRKRYGFEAIHSARTSKER
ncbi:MAG: DNA polymerase IV [Terriglobia bacterium]